MTWYAPRGFWPYLLVQVPDILLAGIVLLLLQAWAGLPRRWVVGLFALWIIKEVAMYPLLRDAFAPPRTGPDTIVGARGVATEPLAPGGYVRLGGELWAAECLPPHGAGIAAGSPIVVRGTRGLTLLVETEERSPPQREKGGVP